MDFLHDFSVEEANACCQRGVWHTGHDISTFDLLGTVSPVEEEEIGSKVREMLDINRRDDCFFVPYYPGMSFDGAIELHRIRNENHNLRRSFGYAIAGLYISGFAALLNFFGVGNIGKFLEWVFKSIVEWVGR